jgi:hypothetical protein
VGRPAYALQGDVGVGDAAGTGLCRLCCPDIVGQAQVDDALDAKPGEVPDAGRIGLRAALKAVVDYAEVPD